MIIAITRLEGKGTSDGDICYQYGHTCYSVSPLRAEIMWERIQEFSIAVNRRNFDCLFFTSALPAQLIGPLIEQWPRVIAIGPETARTLETFTDNVEVLQSHYSRDFVPYVGKWLVGKTVGIPRADVPNPELIKSIEEGGGIPAEVRCYRLIPTNTILDIERADCLLFTSATSFTAARWKRRPDLLLMAIGTVTATAMVKGGAEPAVVGDGSLEGTLQALNSSGFKR